MRIDTYGEAISLLKKYPFFTYAALRASELTDDPDEREHLKTIVALQLSTIPPLPPAETGRDCHKEGADAIDAFLAGYSPDTPMQYMPAGEPTETEGSATAKGAAPDEEPTAEEGPAEEPTEQEKARILIKNRKYKEALAIIERLNLNNPEKSIYFADQIRFLKKLILNQAKS